MTNPDLIRMIDIFGLDHLTEAEAILSIIAIIGNPTAATAAADAAPAQTAVAAAWERHWADRAAAAEGDE